MKSEEALKALDKVRKEISKYDNSRDTNSWRDEFAEISQQLLDFEYGSLRVPILKQFVGEKSMERSVILTSYIDWNGGPVEREILLNGEYPNQSSFSFGQDHPLWLVPHEKFESCLLKDCEESNLLNYWGNNPVDNVRGLPRYGWVAHENDKPNKKTSVIIPLVNYSIIGGNFDCGDKRQRLGVAIFESSKIIRNPKKEIKDALLLLSKTMLDLYVKNFNRGYSNLSLQLFQWREF